MSTSFWVRPGLLALLLVICPALVHANIGDNLDQLRKRYGSAKDMGGQMLFQHDGYSICVYFDGSRSGMEVFVRDGSKPDKLDMTQEDIDAILASQGEGMSWREMRNHAGKPVWMRSDNRLLARLSVGKKPEDKFLTIMVNDR